MSEYDCLSPIGLDCCSCCLDLANGCDESMAQGLGSTGGLPGSPTSPSVSHFRQLRNQLMYQNLNTDKLNNIMRQDSLESVVRDPCFLLNEGICNSNIDQTMLSILLFFHSQVLQWYKFITLASDDHRPLASFQFTTEHHNHFQNGEQTGSGCIRDPTAL
ncbi:Protein mono-ADP-ribosyltransferase PARP4 [Dissostichus eleginoides]|uniref:Protein mono-ADP-ribosyltransferase PARP4 n=1 Tax=Dissostichus eleginoides TaxID=100907 RepID=A0AAD9CLD9_DISEL|nr:Protein mono-ADP-ribosyltransferase PARP4 [Dissostichus eleginoides]